MKWLVLHIGGQKWTVHLVAQKSKYLRHPVSGDRLNGIAFYDSCAIYINRELSGPAFEDTLIHELLHATFSVCGIQHTLEDACKSGRAYATEEQMIISLVPCWQRLLLDLGLKFPTRG